MKGEFEVVHGNPDMIPPHEQWDSNPNIGYSMSPLHTTESTNSLSSRPLIDNQFVLSAERFELTEWMEQVAKHLCEEGSQDTGSDTARTNSLPLEENLILTTIGDHNNRPRKVPRKHYYNNASSNSREDPNWNNGSGLVNQAIIRDENGLRLLTLLLECAVAISVDNLGEAHRMLLELTQMASPYAPSCAERVVAYFSMAMSSRLMNSWLGIFSPLINHRSIHYSFQLFNNISPFIKFAHFTSNQAILEAFHHRDKVHIIDLDIMQGLQWPALFHILATRLEGAPQVRLTGVGASMNLLVETGKQLSNFAKRLGMSFEFHPIAKKFGEIDQSMVQLRRGEAVAVHWLRHSLYDASGPDWKTMRLMQQISPRVVTLVEQEISHEIGGSFLDRFVGSLHYYSTMFDSLGASFSFDDSSRHRVEHGLLYREINNILAIGGPVRSGEEKFSQWRGELARHGFVQVPMSSNSMAQAQLIVKAHGYSLVQGDGTLGLGWKDTCLYTASAWTYHSFT